MSKRQSILIAAGLSLLYFAIQLAYISRLPLVMDEFDGANEAYQLLELTPYQDYRPYKTVLGYYLQLPPLLLTSDPWTGLMLSKCWLALINTAAIFAAAMTLFAIFSPAAALAGQLLLVSMTTFLERSSEIRVDMLTAWVGLAALLLLLKRQWLWAGVTAGLSFLVSQKGVYYIVSANAAAGMFWLLESRDRRTFRDLVFLNAGAGAVLTAYLLLWGLVSSPSTVFSATFLSHGDIAFSAVYELEDHWARTLGKNPFFYWGAVAGIAGLALARWRGYATSTHVMAAVYGAVLFALCRWHKQPWPYFFVILVPTLMVVHVAIADVVLRRGQWLPAAGALGLLMGVAWPFSYMPGILEREHGYQRTVIRLAAAALGEGETYLAGNDLIYNRRQAPRPLRRLSAPRAEMIRAWPPERVDDLIRTLEAEPPKLVIDDYRVRGLPAAFKVHLAKRYAPLGPNINGYAPLLEVNDVHFNIGFDGEYLVEADSGEVAINGNRLVPGSTVTLVRGQHRNASTVPVRLRLTLLSPGLARPGTVIPRRRPLFTRAYDY